MSEEKKSKPLSLGKGKLELKKTVEGGSVRQSFSHGRSKVVQVEVKKKRSFAPGKDGQLQEVASGAPAAAEEKESLLAKAVGGKAAGKGRDALSDDEKAQRLKILQDAMKADEEAQRTADAEAKRKLIEQEEARQAEEAAEAERKKREAEEEEKRKQAEEEAAAAAAAAAAAMPAPEEAARKPAKPVHKPAPATETEESQRKKAARKAEAPKATVKRGEPRRREGKLTISAALEGGDRAERGRSIAAIRRAQEKEKRKMQTGGGMSTEKIVREVTVPESITVQELANRMAERGGNVIKALMKLGVMATINQTIDADTAELVIEEFGHKIKRVSEADVEDILVTGPDDDEHLKSRPPVVTVMGHVDHGKTSLLDALRTTDVVAGEAGGITQHIGAYQVTLKGGDRISFLDTPGHEAFTAMRARGAQVTDIVVLVVAADDGIMPQTIEAITHAKAAEVPMIVAINKMDKPDADPTRVRNELLSHEVVVEEMGGDTLTVEVSAKTGDGLDKLEEAILLQAELLDLKARPDRLAEGTVVEAKVEKGKGSVATVLVQRGTLRVGDIFVAGMAWGRVRALMNDKGTQVKSALPSAPVEVLGFNGTPSAGDEFVVLEDEAKAREIAEYRERKLRQAGQVTPGQGSLEQMFAQIKAGEAKELPVVIKADVQGSVEAIVGTLEKIGNDDVKMRVLHAAVGAISESDLTLAKASGALLVGFNVRANAKARETARQEGLDIRYYSIIYDLADDMKKALTGMLDPTFKENFIGYAEIREVFNITKVGKVAGCMVTQGIIKRGCKVRLLRDDVVIHEGDLSQLKRFKDDAKEVREGFDCGMALARYQDIQVGDMIECFELEQVESEL